MITPRIKPSAFFRCESSQDLFVQNTREARLDGFVENLATMHEQEDFGAAAAQVDAACPRLDRSKGERPLYPTEVMVKMLFLQAV